MKKIGYGINGYKKTAVISIDFAPFCVFVLNDLFDLICGYLVPPISFPRIEITRDGEKTDLKEYYGDLEQWFHCDIHSPVFQFCCKRTDSRLIEVDYDAARKALYDKDKKLWDEAEKLGEEMSQEEKSK